MSTTRWFARFAVPIRLSMALAGSLVWAFAAPGFAAAQTPEADVEAVARALLQGISEGRTDLLEEAMHPQGRLMAVPDEGPPRRQELAAFFEMVGSSAGQFTERMWNPTVVVDGPIAQLWTPYDFYVDGQFSHCGIDAFQMVLEDGAWKVFSLIYTMHRGDDCEPSPLGPPGAS
ncbi:MAG: nuclear transport factor 2 family protein [Longimicrobiales bacterium]